MAAVGPSASRHPSPSRKPTRSRAAPSGQSQPDAFYGHEDVARICARFVTHLFACPDIPPPSSSHPTPAPPLAQFIAYALHRTRLHTSVTFAALYLLQRLKARFPAARGSSGHRLFISAFMLSSKVICDDTYSNKSWSIVGQGMFALREINQMEREMCSYLEWQLNIEPQIMKDFEERVRRDFKGNGPYPTYSLPSPAPSPMPSTTPYNKSAPLQDPSFVAGRPHRSPQDHSSSSSSPVSGGYTPPTPPMSPASPDTPEAYHSTSTSPASTVSPPTPPGHEDLTTKIVTPPGALASSMDARHARVAAQKPAPASRHPTQRRRSDESIAPPVRKPKSSAELFAYAVPSRW